MKSKIVHRDCRHCEGKARSKPENCESGLLPASFLAVRNDAKQYLLSLFLFLFLFLPLQAQDLAGYQKLRGKVLSSEPDDAYTTHAYNAFDTNKGTCFKARDLNGWIGLDLKQRQVIRKIRIYPRADRTERMLGCVFQGSNNAHFSQPTHLLTVTEIPEANQFTTYTISSDQSFRYVRCFSPNEPCNLAELEFYTDENSQTVEYEPLSNLPTIYIETNGMFDFIDKKHYVDSKITVSTDSAVNTYGALVHGRGNSTWDFMEKKPFRIKFDEKQYFLGMPANSKSWTLIACAVDKTFLRNGLAFEISKFLGFEYTPACTFVDVVLDGFYYGTFMASDHIDINKNRINIDEMKASDVQQPNITGGYHLEIDAYADLEPVHFRTRRGVPFTVKSPDSDVIVPLQKAWIENHINKLEDALYQNPAEACTQYIDLESAVKYYLHSELTGNCDSYWCIPAYKKRNDDKLYFGPVWDYDQAFLTNERVPRFSATLDTQHGVAQHWFRIIMQLPEAQKILHKLWKQVKDGNLEYQLLYYLYKNADLLQQSQALNYERWDCLNRRVWFEDALFNTYGEYIDFVAGFIEDRFAWLDDILSKEKLYILPASKPGNPIQTWRYVTENPENPDWFAVAYDDSGWLSGQAPFGTERDLQNTYWNGDEIYIRTTFYAQEADLQKIEKMYLDVFHDEDCWIYINGQPALQLSDYNTDYQTFEIDKSLILAGENTLAVKCTQTIGGQLIDVGVFGTFTQQEEPNSIPQIQLPVRYFIRNGILHVDTEEKGATVKLYSIDGRLLKQQKTSGEEIVIPLPGRGIYLLSLSGKTVKIRVI